MHSLYLVPAQTFRGQGALYSMGYFPFSGKAVGSLTFPPLIEVENFDFNPSHFFLSSSITDPVANLTGLFPQLVFVEEFHNHLLESLEILKIFMNERVDRLNINFPIQMNQPVTKPGHLYQR